MKIKRSKALLAICAVVVLAITTFTIFTFRFAPSVKAYDAWYDADWSYRKKITIHHDQVSATLTDFPIMINLSSDTDLALNAQDDGDDIFFILNGEVTKLSHEIETFNGGTGELVAWVKIPSLSSTTDTELYLYYGNISAANQENTTDVWSNKYAAVWHLNESSGNALDSTENGISGTIQPGVTQGNTGMIGKYYSFNGAGWVNFGSPTTLPYGRSPKSISAWAKTNTTAAGFRWAAAYGNPSTNQAFFFGLNGTTLDGGGYGGDLTSNSFWTVGEWKQVNLTYTGTQARLYGNGVPLTSPINKGWDTIINKAYLGRQVNNSEYWDGDIDEVRISSVDRSAEWIATEYANQNPLSTFYILDASQERETTPPSNPTTFKTYSSSGKTLEYQSGDWLNASAPYFEWSGIS